MDLRDALIQAETLAANAPDILALLKQAEAKLPVSQPPLPGIHPVWPHDDTKSKMAFYGDFNDKSWASLNLIHVHPPFEMRYEGKPLPSGILVHRKIADALLAVFQDVWEACGRNQAEVDKTGISDYGGCFNIRNIAGSGNWSNHSWACAIDLSPGTNGFGAGHGTIGNLVVEAFKKQGFLWGGDYHGRTDPMHFEAVSR